MPFIKRIHLNKMLLIVITIGMLNGCRRDHPFPPSANIESASVIYDWYKLMIHIQLYTNPPPVVIKNNRDFGYIGVGLYEAVRPGINHSVSLSSILYQMPVMPEPVGSETYLWGASANAALAGMFRLFVEGLTNANKLSIDSLENAYRTRFIQAASKTIVDRSEAFGRAVATAIYNWSLSDNFNLSSIGYVLPDFPGAWKPTPPLFVNPVGPFLKDSRPFLKSSLTAEIPSIPVAYSEMPSSNFYKAAKDVYYVGESLTEEQKSIANFWADVGGPGIGYPGPGHIISIVTGVLQKQGARLAQAAEIYAKTGIAHKDAFFRVWKIKYKYNLVRPVTYIQKHIESTWLPFLITPPYPEFSSGLAGIYTPVMRVLAREFGDIPITDNTYAWNGSAPRKYSSITALTEEVAVSRVYGGIHFRFTQNLSVDIGNKFGDEIADIHLSRFTK